MTLKMNSLDFPHLGIQLGRELRKGLETKHQIDPFYSLLIGFDKKFNGQGIETQANGEF